MILALAVLVLLRACEASVPGQWPTGQPKGSLEAAPSKGIPGLDYFHYTKTNFDNKTKWKDVTLTKWAGDKLGELDLSLGKPAFNLIEWANASTTNYPASTCWFRYDTIYFIVEGSVTVTVGVGSKAPKTQTLVQSDTLWVRAGTAHSSFKPVGSKVRIITAVAPYEPLLTTAPITPRDTKSKKDYAYRFYLNKDCKRSGGGIDHYLFSSLTNSDPTVLNVVWKPKTTIGLHFHAEGALYIPSKGTLCFAGEMPTDCRVGGEARWARPGYRYAGEETNDEEGAQIIVLNTESPPNMGEASPADFLSTHHVSINYVTQGTPVPNGDEL